MLNQLAEILVAVRYRYGHDCPEVAAVRSRLLSVMQRGARRTTLTPKAVAKLLRAANVTGIDVSRACGKAPSHTPRVRGVVRAAVSAAGGGCNSRDCLVRRRQESFCMAIDGRCLHTGDTELLAVMRGHNNPTPDFLCVLAVLGDEFVQVAVSNAKALAAHRGSATVSPRDLRVHVEHCCGVVLPFFDHCRLPAFLGAEGGRAASGRYLMAAHDELLRSIAADAADAADAAGVASVASAERRLRLSDLIRVVNARRRWLGLACPCLARWIAERGAEHTTERGAEHTTERAVAGRA